MVKHGSGTQWPGDMEVGWRHMQSAPCTWRRGARVSWLSLKTNVVSLSVVWPQNHYDGFLSLDLKTNNSGLVIWDSKSSWQFISDLTLKPLGRVSWLSLKTKVDSLSVVWPQNHWDDFLACVSKSSGLLFVDSATKPTEGDWCGTRVKI
jgi:hypothetical protein